jgi:hypothetical protein
MDNNLVCENKKTALLILDTITKNMAAGTQRSSLEALGAYITSAVHDIPETFEERQDQLKKLRYELRNCMNSQKRREEAAFLLEGLDENLIVPAP